MNNMKNVVVVGGGTGLSVLLNGLKVFPINITAIVAVTDDGGSTGKLREIYDIPAMGDIRRVLSSLSDSQRAFESMMEYSLEKIDGHKIGNLILTALYEETGSLTEATRMLSDVLKINGRVLPALEESTTLEGVTITGEVIRGETSIDKCPEEIDYVQYHGSPEISDEVVEAYLNADLIVLSMGSLFTSTIPPIIADKAKEAISKSKAKKIYVCNAMSSSEVLKYNVSDFVGKINQHMGLEFLDAVICNRTSIPKDIQELYEEEQAHPVLYDEENLENIEVILSDMVQIDDNMVRHKSFKVASTVFTYLLNQEEL